MTMYAGNQYHLIVETGMKTDGENINYFKSTDPVDLVVYYSPRNETAWTESDDIEIIEAGDDSDGLRSSEWMAVVWLIHSKTSSI